MSATRRMAGLQMEEPLVTQKQEKSAEQHRHTCHGAADLSASCKVGCVVDSVHLSKADQG